jgi:hypothetical protein
VWIAPQLLQELELGLKRARAHKKGSNSIGEREPLAQDARSALSTAPFPRRGSNWPHRPPPLVDLAWLRSQLRILTMHNADWPCWRWLCWWRLVVPRVQFDPSEG